VGGGCRASRAGRADGRDRERVREGEGEGEGVRVSFLALRDLFGGGVLLSPRDGDVLCLGGPVNS
jgi:hypothetical protein